LGGSLDLVAPGIPAVAGLAGEHFELRRARPQLTDDLGKDLGLLAGFAAFGDDQSFFDQPYAQRLAAIDQEGEVVG